MSSTYFTAFSTFFLHFPRPVSLFDLEARFFAPTHTCRTPARAGAVKIGRRSGFSSRSSGTRPHLYGAEHDCMLMVVGMRFEGSPLSGHERARAATLYSVGRDDPYHDARMRIGGGLRGGGPILDDGIEAMVRHGTPPPRTVIASPSITTAGRAREREVDLDICVRLFLRGGPQAHAS